MARIEAQTTGASVLMIGWFKKRALLRASAEQLYGSSVAQARNKTFYAAWAVPDTIEGRYEVISLHLFLLVERLQDDGDAGGKLARTLLETFMTDLDDNMREMGVGDLKVPGHVKKAAAGLYDRFADYAAATAGKTPGDEALELAVEARFLALGGDPPEPAAELSGKPSVAAPEPVDIGAIAAYMRAATSLLASQSAQSLFAGNVEFPQLPRAAYTVATSDATGSG